MKFLWVVLTRFDSEMASDCEMMRLRGVLFINSTLYQILAYDVISCYEFTREESRDLIRPV